MLAKINIGDWGIKAGALVLAIFLWFHAITEQLYETETVVRLLVEDPPPGDIPEMIVSSEIPAVVRVLASGRGKDLLRLDGDAFVLRVQSEGNARTYRLMPSQIEKRTSDLDVQITEILEPKEIEVVLDRRMEREIPVWPGLEVQVAEAHIQVGPVQTDPLKVRVIGPRSQVEKLSYILTDSLVLHEVREEVDVELSLQPPAHTRLVLNPDRVRVHADIQILAEDDLAGVPVTVRNMGKVRLRPEPALVRVKVRGGVDVIANLDPASDLELYVDYAEYQGTSMPVRSAENSHFEVREILPATVNLVGD